MYSTLGEMEIAPRRCAPGPGKQGNSGRASSARLTLRDEPRNLYRWSSSRNSLGSCSASIILRKVWCGSTLEEMTWPRISSPLARATPVARPFLTRMRAIGAWVRISTPGGICTAGVLPSEFLEELQRYKFRGSSGKVNLALDALPEFRCLPGPGAHLRGAISISPSVEYMERAYDDAKYGNFSRCPYIDVVIPSLTDPSVAPPGKHVLSCFVQYAPYKLKEGTWDEKREAFGDTVIDALAQYAPNLKDIILGRQVLTPLDLEREFGLTEGNIFQGELSLEQLFFLRPVPGWAQYRTPIKRSEERRVGKECRSRWS